MLDDEKLLYVAADGAESLVGGVLPSIALRASIANEPLTRGLWNPTRCDLHHYKESVVSKVLLLQLRLDGHTSDGRCPDFSVTRPGSDVGDAEGEMP